MKEPSEFIKDFINNVRNEYGDTPKFIHTTSHENVVNYSGPTFDDDELVAIIDSVMFGTWLSSGDKVRQFEMGFSEMFNHKDSVMVNSGSSANLLMIAALKQYFGWRDGDEIILSVVGFPTTLSSLILNKLHPVFVDIEWDTLNFDLRKVSDAITLKTKAIFLSPVLGNPPDMDVLDEICKRFDIQLILDNCDSLGSKWGGRYLTNYAVTSSCSFYPAHHITTGEGGMISSDIKDVVRISRSMASWGRDCTCVGIENLISKGSCNSRFKKWLPEQDIILDHKYVFSNIGYNLKPLDLQGAIGLAQLNKFERIYSDRIQNKHAIDVIIRDALRDVNVIDALDGASPCWFGVPIICPDKEYKVKIVSFLEKNNIQTRNYFAGNILLHKAYRDLGDWMQYPEANKVLERVFFLGCSPNYTQKTLSYIENVVHKFSL